MCLRRRVIGQSPRYLLTWQCRRLSTASSSYLWMPLCRRSHTVLPLRTYLRRWVLVQPPRSLLTRLCRLLYAVLYYTILPHNYRSRSSSSDVSSLTILLTVKARHRRNAILVVPHRLNLLTLLRLGVSAVPVLTETSCCSHHRVSNSMPRLQVSIRMPTCAPHMENLLKAAPLRPCLCSAISVTLPQPPVSTIHVGTHPVRSATTGKRSASTALAGTHNPVDADPRAGTGPFPKPRALVLPSVHFGQSKPDGHGYIDTADSDLVHHQFRFFPPSVESRPGVQKSY